MKMTQKGVISFLEINDQGLLIYRTKGLKYRINVNKIAVSEHYMYQVHFF